MYDYTLILVYIGLIICLVVTITIYYIGFFSASRTIEPFTIITTFQHYMYSNLSIS